MYLRTICGQEVSWDETKITSGVSSFVMLFSLTMAVVAQNNSKMVSRDDVAAAAFEAMSQVLHHPRCMNCHSKGDFPRQGDDRHRHSMNVHRGSAGDGIAGAKCSSCHQDHANRHSRTRPAHDLRSSAV
jgi:hypothetical protein